MDNKTDFGVKVYTYLDVVFCMARILFGMYLLYWYQLYFPVILLSVLLGCKFLTLCTIVATDKITSNSIHDFSKHEDIINKLNIINKRMALYTVAIPHAIQFVLCFYIAVTLCMYANESDYIILMWTLGILIVLFDSIFSISAMDIFSNEGVTISLKNICFDTTKNYWGEGLTIIFLAILYIIVASYFCYETILSYLNNSLDYISAIGVILFVLSAIQTVKYLNIPDICKLTFGNIKFFNYLTYMDALIKVRKDYCKRQLGKTLLLGMTVFVFVISVAFVFIRINCKLEMPLDSVATLICLLPISLTLSIFLLKRMCEAPLLYKLFDDDECAVYFSEYIDVSDNSNCSLPIHIDL